MKIEITPEMVTTLRQACNLAIDERQRTLAAIGDDSPQARIDCREVKTQIDETRKAQLFLLSIEMGKS